MKKSTLKPEKRIKEKRPTNYATSHRLSPISRAQLDELRDYMGETSSEVIARAIDTLFHFYVTKTDFNVALRNHLEKAKKHRIDIS